MRVLFLERQPCVRAMKYAVALRGLVPGMRISFAYQGRTLTEWYGAGDELFEHWWRLPIERPGDALAQVVAEERPDLIHSHNLPDELTAVALAAVPDVPVVHDVHDLHSLRNTPYEDGLDQPPDPDALERRAVEGAAALVAVSDEMVEAIAHRHRLPERVCVFPNYALARDLPELGPPPEGRGDPLRVVYQGTLSTNGGHYDLRDGLRAAAAAGLLVDVLPNRDAPAYSDLVPGVRLLPKLAPRDVPTALVGYDAGWACFNPGLNADHLHTALPNKLYEYIGAGLPVIGGRHRALARELRRLGVGLVVDPHEDLAGRLAEADLEGMRARARAVRSELTVEANVHRLLEVYEAIAGVPVTR
jgi:glycosyltransferase involved in cell wall biosynthesis